MNFILKESDDIMQCLLCLSKTEKFIKIKDREYFQCTYCLSIMLNPQNYISSQKEKERYLEHNNDVYDVRYQKFVSPIVDRVLNDYNKKHKGLDFGSGTGPVITKLLEDNRYDIDIYDPFFADQKEKLTKSYDYIVCCEVMEHFHHPRLEFGQFQNMLNHDGTLYLKTSVYSESIDFESWYYKDDPTHVFFYHENALEYIKHEYSYSDLIITKDVIVYKNNVRK